MSDVSNSKKRALLKSAPISAAKTSEKIVEFTQTETESFSNIHNIVSFLTQGSVRQRLAVLCHGLFTSIIRFWNS